MPETILQIIFSLFFFVEIEKKKKEVPDDKNEKSFNFITKKSGFWL